LLLRLIANSRRRRSNVPDQPDIRAGNSTAAEIMEAATAVAALSARVAYDSKLAAELVDAQHKRDVARVRELLHVTGVPVEVSLTGPPSEGGATPELKISGGITITHSGGNWGISITVSVSK
jgi:hypothetical protein